ncbi:MAG TPA: DUF1007 family protein [Stellaceae bacterium]|nr:DUF1007 family protein [Stellaceae bacterium]
MRLLTTRAALRIVSVVGSLIWAMPAMAHPHIFIEQAMTVTYGKTVADKMAVTGVRMTWTFDDLYSSMLRNDYTENPDGPLTEADIRNLEKHAFGNLASVHYFTTVTINGTPVPVAAPTHFTAHATGDKVTYEFTVPISTPPKPGQNTVEVMVFDPEYYVDFEAAAKDPVKVTGQKPGGPQPDCRSVGDKRDTIGWGKVQVDELVCSYGGGG